MDIQRTMAGLKRSGLRLHDCVVRKDDNRLVEQKPKVCQ